MRLILFFVILMTLAPKSFAETISYKCSFLFSASPSGIEKESKPFELSFVLDTQTKKAYMLGNNGSSEVMPVENIAGITFVEVTPSGNVMVTAITTSGDAVHSRNTIFLDGKKLIPSQYYGKCNTQ
jgi:hypothetical protein